MPYDYNDAMYEAGGFVDEYLKNLEPEFRKHSNIEDVPFTKLEQRQIEVLHDHLTETLANILYRLNVLGGLTVSQLNRVAPPPAPEDSTV